MLELLHAQRLSETLIGLAVLLQSVELIRIAPSLADTGVWDWRILREEYRFLGPLRFLLDLLLRFPNVLYLFLARSLGGLLLTLYSHPLLLLFLLVSSVLISLRWRGTFNGGSDYMSIIVLSALLLASSASESSVLPHACLLYIGLQTISSYFISGIVKLKKRNWRHGLALPVFLANCIYQETALIKSFRENRGLMLCGSWGIMLFEIGFPLALISPGFSGAILSVALLFHLANFYLFGLNRFLFAWAAAYPAVYYCSSVLAASG